MTADSIPGFVGSGLAIRPALWGALFARIGMTIEALHEFAGREAKGVRATRITRPACPGRIGRTDSRGRGRGETGSVPVVIRDGRMEGERGGTGTTEPGRPSARCARPSRSW